VLKLPYRRSRRASRDATISQANQKCRSRRPSFRKRIKMETERLRLPFFKGPQDNFLYWSAQIKSTLKAKRVWSVVRAADAPVSSVTQTNGNNEEQVTESSVVVYQDDDEKRDVACSIILRSLGPVPFASIMKHQENPRMMWSLLHSRYASSTTFSKASVQTKLARTKYAGQAMDVYVPKWEQLSSQLDVMNASIDEGLLITMFLESFGNRSKSDYGSTISALLSKDTLEWHTVSTRLIQEYQSVTLTKTTGGGGVGSAEQAFRTDDMRKTRKCWYCNKPGHIKSECYKRKKDLGVDDERPGRKRGESALMMRSAENRSMIAERALMDSGASSHMFKSRTWMDGNANEIDTPITTANNSTMSAKIEGAVNVTLRDGGDVLRLSRVLYVPEISDNLISVSSLCSDGYSVAFEGESCTVRKGREIIGCTKREGGTYVFDIQKVSEAARVAKSSDERMVHLWHSRLGHADKNIR